MLFDPLLLIACSLIAVIRTTQGYVSDVNPHLTTAGPPKKVHEVTVTRSGKRQQVRAMDNDRIIFPSSWSQSDLVQTQDQMSRASQGGHPDSALAGDSNTRGSFTNSHPSIHSVQLKSSFSKYQAPVHPFERDDEDDGPIWQD
uniref:Exodeoxyribonuclease 7 large subunit n=1 Tax=Lygus hesperus TaxID=30085 RepID=A0A0A9ZFE2_LYGHE